MADQDQNLPKIGSLPTRVYRFSDLHLEVDHRLQIELPTARMGEYFYTKLLGYLKGSSLIVKLPTSWSGNVPLGEGDNVTVRGFSGRIAYSFSSDILKIRYAPYPYCHLSFPSEILGAEIRKAVRVRVDIPARVTNLRLGDDVAMEASITNLSALGIQMHSRLNLGEPGDSVALSFRFWLQPNDYEVNFSAAGIIKSRQAADEGSGWSHGIRFQGMRSSEAILLQHLIYEYLIVRHAMVV